MESLPSGPLKLLVVGAGAIGCLVGGTLAKAGHSVTLVGRQGLVDAVTRSGLQLSVDGRPQVISNLRAVSASADAFPASGGPFDLIVLTVKSYDTDQALAELCAAVGNPGPHTPAILSLQNGVGNEEAIAAVFGPSHTIAGTITAPVEIPAPGVVRVTKSSFVVGLAPWTPGAGSGVIERLAGALTAAGVHVTRYGDARGMKWSKLIMNMIGNATSAILAEPPAVTFADPRIADLEIDALREALAVMDAGQIPPVNVGKYPLARLAPFLRRGPRPLLRFALGRIVAGARGGKMPSLYLDLEKGRSRSEVEWLNGAVVAAGAPAGVATTVNDLLVRTVLHLARFPEERPTWRANHGRLAEAAGRAGARGDGGP